MTADRLDWDCAPRFYDTWRSVVRGIGSTFGIAQVRRPVESPEDALHAVKFELNRVIEVIKGCE